MYTARILKDNPSGGANLRLFASRNRWEAGMIAELTRLMQKYGLSALRLPKGTACFETGYLPAECLRDILVDLERMGFSMDEKNAMETAGFDIGGHAFFKDLEEKYLVLIAGCAKRALFKEGEVILEEGKPADHFYLIEEGLVAIQVQLGAQDPITIQTISAGDILGWSWLIPPHNNRFSCRAVEPTRTIAFDGKCLRYKCEKNHELGYDLLKRLAKVFAGRLEATRLQLINLYER